MTTRLRVLGQPLITLDNPHHHFAGDGVFHLFGDGAGGGGCANAARLPATSQ
jgi:hypothetical protein